MRRRSPWPRSAVCGSSRTATPMIAEPIATEGIALAPARLAAAATILPSSQMPRMALAYFGEDIDTHDCASSDRAMALHPSFARGWYIGGNACELGRPIRTAQSSGSKPRSVSARAVGSVLSCHNIAEPIFSCSGSMRQHQATFAIQDDRIHGRPYRFLISCYAHMGRLDDARDCCSTARVQSAPGTPDRAGYLSQEIREYRNC